MTAGYALIPLLPRRSILLLAYLSSRIAYYGVSHMRYVGRENLNLAFGTRKTKREKINILKKSYQVMALSILDLFWFARKPVASWTKWIDIDSSLQVIETPKRQICVTAHLGNWEILGKTSASRGNQLVSIASHLPNPLINHLFNRLRYGTGQIIVPQEGALKHLLQALRENKKVALVMDQNTKPSEGGIFVDYFGVPVPVSEAAAALAIRTRSEIVIGFCRPLKKGRYRIYVSKCITPDREASSYDLTQKITTCIEREVRAHPEAWAWTYKRWKHIKPGEERAAYPDYAKRMDSHEQEKAGRDEAKQRQDKDGSYSRP